MSFLFRRAAALFCAVAAIATNISAANAFDLEMPTKLPTPRRKEPVRFTPNLLLVMPNKGLKSDDLDDTMEEVHGTVVGSMGEGDLKCYIVKTEQGHFEDAEKKLTKDRKHFAAISRNYYIAANKVPDAGRDPDFASNQWHLQTLHCPDAWNHATGSGVRMAIFDTGCAASNADLAGKTDKGFDASGAVGKILAGLDIFFPFMKTPGMTEVAGAAAGLLGGRADSDDHGHGTWVATTAAATFNNPNFGVGVAPNARIYPVKIDLMDNPFSKSHRITTDIEVIAGLINVMGNPDIRIVNISYNAPVVGFHNAKLHSVLHSYFLRYFLIHQGLIFISAGNEGVLDPTPPALFNGLPYICLVSAVGQNRKLADFSNYGPGITFTAPGVDIGCSDRNNASATGNNAVDGTSFSCPIVAAIAALILDKKPAAPAVEVLRTLIASCKQVKGTAGFNWYYGWGMPDAYNAVGNTGRPPVTDGASTSPPSFNRVAHGSRRDAATGSGGVVIARP